MNIKIALASLAAVLALAACGTPAATVTVTAPPPSTSAAAESASPAVEETSEAPSPSAEPTEVADVAVPDPLDADGNYVGHNWGTQVPFPDFMIVSVSAPEPYTPSESAAMESGYTGAVKVTVTMKNTTKAPLDSMTLTTSATTGDRPAPAIYDSANDVNGNPYSTILPGASINFVEAYSVDEGQPFVVTVESWEAEAFTMFRDRS